MADETSVIQTEPTTTEATTQPAPAETQPAEPAAFQPITTQEEFYLRVKDQIGRALASAVPDDYEDAKAEAAKVPDLLARAEKAESALAELQHAKELSEWRDKVAAETGIPAAALRGDTEDELREHAKAIRASMPVYPQVSEGGGLDQGVPMTKDQILGIRNAAERRAAILANLELFN